MKDQPTRQEEGPGSQCARVPDPLHRAGRLLVPILVLACLIVALTRTHLRARQVILDNTKERVVSVRELIKQRLLEHSTDLKAELLKQAQGRPCFDRQLDACSPRRSLLSNLMMVDQAGKVLRSTFPTGQVSALQQEMNSARRGASPLAGCLRQGRSSSSGEVAFTDYGHYKALDRVTAFFCVRMGDRVTPQDAAPGVVLVAELNTERVNQLADGHLLLGRSGATYIVGPKGNLRSDVHARRHGESLQRSFGKRTDYATSRVTHPLPGRPSEKFTVDVHDEHVLSTSTPVKVFGRTWAVIAKVHRNQVLRPVYHMLWYARFSALLALLLVAYFAFPAIRSRWRGAARESTPPPPAARRAEAAPSGRRLKIILLGACAALSCTSLLLPLKPLEPDDLAFKRGMMMFASGSIHLERGDFGDPDQGGGGGQAGSGGDGQADSGAGRALPEGWTAVPGSSRVVFEKTPGHALMLALFHKVGLQRLVNPLWVLLCLWLLWRLFREMAPGQHRFAAFAVLLFATNPTLYIMTYRTYMSDLSSAAAVTCFILLFLMGELRKRNSLYLWAGLFLGASVSIRIGNLAIYCLVPVYFLARGWLWGRPRPGLLNGLREPGLWLVLVGGCLPLVGLLVYNAWSTGNPLEMGYNFTLWTHNYPKLGEFYLIHNLLDVPPLLVLGFPALLLFPLGLGALCRTQPRAALVSVLLLLLTFGLHMIYDWGRQDHFIFTSRLYLPGIIALTLGAAAALASIPSKRAGFLCVCAIMLLSVMETGDFFRHHIYSERPTIREGGIDSRCSCPWIRYSPEGSLPGD